MMRFSAGDVVRVPFPYVETNRRRVRPALVISDSHTGLNDTLIWMLMITSAERERWPGDVEIDDLEGTGLPIVSIIRTAKVATLEAKRIERIGRVKAALLAKVRNEIQAIIAKKV